MDFSKTTIVGATAGTEDNIVDRYFQWWNSLVIKENQKYDIKKFFRKSAVNINLAYISQLNAERNRESLFAHNENEITEDELSKHIENYQVEGDGVGFWYMS